MTMIKIPDPPEFGEDGVELPRAAPGSDLERVITLLEYCRIREFALAGPLRIGDVYLSVRDLRQESGKRGPDDPGPWKEHGFDERAD